MFVHFTLVTDSETGKEELAELDRYACGTGYVVPFADAGFRFEQSLSCFSCVTQEIQTTDSRHSVLGAIEPPGCCENPMCDPCGSRILLKLVDGTGAGRFALRTPPIECDCGRCACPGLDCSHQCEMMCPCCMGCDCPDRWYTRRIPVSLYSRYEIVAHIDIRARFRGSCTCGRPLEEHARITVTYPEGTNDNDKQLLVALAIQQDVSTIIPRSEPGLGAPVRHLDVPLLDPAVHK